MTINDFWGSIQAFFHLQKSTLKYYVRVYSKQGKPFRNPQIVEVHRRFIIDVDTKKHMLQTPISQIHNIYICYARLNIYIVALVIINNYIHINTIHHRTTQFECVRLDHTAQTVPTGCQESDVCVCVQRMG